MASFKDWANRVLEPLVLCYTTSISSCICTKNNTFSKYFLYLTCSALTYPSTNLAVFQNHAEPCKSHCVKNGAAGASAGGMTHIQVVMTKSRCRRDNLISCRSNGVEEMLPRSNEKLEAELGLGT